MNRTIRLINDSLKTDSALQKIGAIEKTHACLKLDKEHDTVVFTDVPAGMCVLELDELHNTAKGSFSYLVLVDGQVVYQRTMEPVSNSVCPCLVQLRLDASAKIEIRMVGGEVWFTDIFLHTDIAYVLENYIEPMEIGLCFPRPTYTDRDADLAKMCKIRDDFADLKHFTVSLGEELKFMQISDAQIQGQLDYILGLAREAKVNMIFNFNSWWDGTPSGRDGKGGYFADTEYHQVVYDPISGKKMLSVPNLWRNTPWYTMNHDHLNQVRKTRLAAALDLLGKKMAAMKLEPGFVPTIRILIDNEPTYWAEFAYSSSPEAGGDFNEHAIRAAAGDGVDLNPSGDLKHEQKLWLLRNLCTYMTDVSKTYHACCSSEYAVVSNDGVSYGEHHLTENVMTHVQGYAGHPYADERYMRHEEHVNPYARFGIETCGHQDERVLSYFPATGRYAQVNAERCCYTDPAFHHQYYGHGAFTDIIFNCFYDTDVAHVHQLDDLEDAYLPQQICGSEVMRFSPYDGKLTDPCIVSVDNVEISPLRERRILRPSELGNGSITFCLGKASDYPNGGWLELKGLIRPLNGSISLTLGTDLNGMAEARKLPEWDADHQLIAMKVDLKDVLASANAEDPVYATFLFDNQYYDDWAQMNAIWEVRGVAAFETHVASADSLLKLPLHRAVSMLISYRNDCQRLKEQYPHISVAETSDYKEMYKQLMHRISVDCTEKFLVCGTGYLEKYGITVNSGENTIGMTVKNKDSGWNVIVSGEPGQSVALSVDSCQLSAKLLDDGTYFVEKNNAQLQREVVLAVPDAPAKKMTFVGTFVRYDADKQMLEACTHDPAWGYQALLQFACSRDVAVTLVPSEVTGNMLDHITTNPYTPAAILNARIDAEPTVLSLNKGDMIRCELVGNRITKLNAVRGLARGKIVALEEISLDAPMHNAFLTLETAPGQTAVFELGMNTHLNYQRAHGENPVLAGDLPLELTVNNIVLITFEPETVPGRPYRALQITMV